MTLATLFVFLLATEQPVDRLRSAFNRPGSFRSKSSECTFSMRRSGMGEGLILHLPRKKPVIDVTGATFYGAAELVYSVSPIYGSPGVFKFNCKSGITSVIVKPRTFDRGYPKGADYFELRGVRDADKLIYFYYLPHVDGPGIEQLREEVKHLFEVRGDGSEMRKVREP